jgi:hypothetical protein
MEDRGWKNLILQTHKKFAQAAENLKDSSTKALTRSHGMTCRHEFSRILFDRKSGC